jgi:ubiquinol-cytochrome c reductase cytochrome b subunit
MPRLSLPNINAKKTALDVYGWVERRVQVEAFVKDSALHPVPKNTASWWYVFGSAATALLVLQILTGIFLALVYTPSAGQAWQSLNFLNNNLTLGWFLRAMHGWGSDFMVAVVLVHMMQVFMFGAYKFPRELTWCLGVGLLLLTLGMAFTGQVLRYDTDAYWGLGIGASIASRVPVLGPYAVHALLGGPIIGGATLTRFFALHVFVIPGLMLGLAGLHVWLVLKLGINEWPAPGRIVRRSTYMKEYHELAHKDGIAFVPGAVWKDLFFSAAIFGAVALCAVIFGPFGPGGEPNPINIQVAPKPDYFFLWLYSILSYLPNSLETPFLLVVPPIAIGALFALPFVAGEGEKHWSRRPVAVLTLITMAIGLAILNHLGTYEPWSPKMTAWSGYTLPVHKVLTELPIEHQGALVFQGKQCRNCHEIGGTGGLRGPALDNVATRLTYDQLVRQVLQGGGNMPAYGKNLSPAQTTAVVAFLETMHPAGEPPARNAATPNGRPDNEQGNPLIGPGPMQNSMSASPALPPTNTSRNRTSPSPGSGKVKAATNQAAIAPAPGSPTTISLNTPPALVHAH